MFLWKNEDHKRRKGYRKANRSAVAFSSILLCMLLLCGAACPPRVQAAGTAVVTSLRSGDIVCPSAGASVTLPTAIGGTSAQSAVLIEATGGTVIFSQNENARLPMASTTKIMTALVALESCPLDDTVVIPAEAVGVEGSSIYLAAGEQLTMEDLLYALMLSSANDAAVAIAIHAAGSVETFVERMNRKAADLGLTSTHFVNPHGLDDEAHYTTAKELAIITRAAMENTDFRIITGTARRVIPLQGTAGSRLLLNHNKMLRQYDGVIGGKTGFTKASGRCLVSVAERDGVSLIAVTLGDPNDWKDHATMLDYGFSLYESVMLCEAADYDAPLPLQSGVTDYVMVSNASGISLPLRRDHGDIICTVELPHLAFAPVASGAVVGRLVFTEVASDGTSRVIADTPLTARYEVEAKKYRRTFWEWLVGLFKK